MKFPCVEATVDVVEGFRIVRLWLDLDGEIPDNLWEFTHKEIINVKRLMREIPANKDLLMRLCEIPGLNAVQLQIRTEEDVTHGAVVYLVPFENLKG